LECIHLKSSVEHAALLLVINSNQISPKFHFIYHNYSNSASRDGFDSQALSFGYV